MGIIIMNNILVTGSNGQLGNEIKKLSSIYRYNFFFTTKEDLDITSLSNLEKFISQNQINIIINAAAHTAVDSAEKDYENADEVNHRAVKHISRIAKEHNIKLVHISTDYVFDGKNYKPYLESDITNPNGIYGKTKLSGEKAMLKISPNNSIIIRTSWVYSSFGENFVKTMLRLGKERDTLGVIYDQVGTPTYARDLAKTILEILPKIRNNNVEIYNFSNEGALSWYDFAKEIIRVAKLECQIKPIETSEYPTLVMRPYYSLLNKAKIKKDFNIDIPYWKDSLEECLKTIGEKNNV